jgi:uncharacterized Tic20 family protein
MDTPENTPDPQSDAPETPPADTPAADTPPTDVPPTPPPPGGDGSLVGPKNNDDKNMGLLAHLLGIISCFIGPLIIYLVKSSESDSFARQEAVEALNFQITLLIAYVVSMVLMIICIGYLTFMLTWIAGLIFCIMGAIAASKGEPYRYPISIRLIT